jgi:hypothetical protein
MNLTKKSRTISLLLTILLGPLGLVYGSGAGGVILIIVAIVTAPTLIGPVICWVLAIAVGDHCVYKHNKGIDDFKKLILTSRQGG